MQFHTGTAIFDESGNKVGRLSHVIVNPQTMEVDEIVLAESGFLGTDVIVPVDAVTQADHESVTLALNQDQIRQLQSFVRTSYAEPPADLVLPAPWAEGALVYGMGPLPVGAAAMANMAPTVMNYDKQIPEGDIDIEPGTEVWATDGKVGKVHELVVDDDTNRVTGFVVREGLFFTTDQFVPIEAVASLTDDRVNLNRDKEALAPAHG